MLGTPFLLGSPEFREELLAAVTTPNREYIHGEEVSESEEQRAQRDDDDLDRISRDRSPARGSQVKGFRNKMLQCSEPTPFPCYLTPFGLKVIARDTHGR